MVAAAKSASSNVGSVPGVVMKRMGETRSNDEEEEEEEEEDGDDPVFDDVLLLLLLLLLLIPSSSSPPPPPPPIAANRPHSSSSSACASKNDSKLKLGGAMDARSFSRERTKSAMSSASLSGRIPLIRHSLGNPGSRNKNCGARPLFGSLGSPYDPPAAHFWMSSRSMLGITSGKFRAKSSKNSCCSGRRLGRWNCDGTEDERLLEGLEEEEEEEAEVEATRPIKKSNCRSKSSISLRLCSKIWGSFEANEFVIWLLLLLLLLLLLPILTPFLPILPTTPPPFPSPPPDVIRLTNSACILSSSTTRTRCMTNVSRSAMNSARETS
mmetsp:Transcript_23555/g.41923  ORF Transcript_23555/g.41923 Transcript_23555/m.41923 type:complete len:325 (-) Transcript_23555:946-1920(-)